MTPEHHIAMSQRIKRADALKKTIEKLDDLIKRCESAESLVIQQNGTYCIGPPGLHWPTEELSLVSVPFATWAVVFDRSRSYILNILRERMDQVKKEYEEA